MPRAKPRRAGVRRDISGELLQSPGSRRRRCRRDLVGYRFPRRGVSFDLEGDFEGALNSPATAGTDKPVSVTEHLGASLGSLRCVPR